LILGADVLTAASTLVLALFFLFGYRELWLIFLVSAIRSVGAGIQAPAVNALLPQIVPVDRLMKVNSINSTIQPFIMILSPVLAGAMLSFSSLEAIFFIDVVTAAMAVGLLLAISVPPLIRAQAGPAEKQPGYLDDLRAGLAFIGQNRTIKTLFIFFAFTFFLVTPVAFLTPLLVARSFGDEVWRLTANEVTFFAGSILGGVLMTLWGGFPNRFRTIGLACVMWAVLFTGLGLTQNFIIYLILMFLAGIPMPFFGATTTTMLQEIVQPEMQGRVFGVQNLIFNTVMPVAMLFFGPVSDVMTIEMLLVLASALMAIPGIWIFFRPQPAAPQAEFEMQVGD
jgi:MFS transporter, DHA3 family, macrolide efflux protein